MTDEKQILQLRAEPNDTEYQRQRNADRCYDETECAKRRGAGSDNIPADEEGTPWAGSIAQRHIGEHPVVPDARKPGNLG